jgi:hypothetical protein
VATSTDHLLPWVSGQWRLAESEIAWVRWDGPKPLTSGHGLLRMRLSVACWRAGARLAASADANSGWRYWPGIELSFNLAAQPTIEPATPWGDLIGRITHGECQPADNKEKTEVLALDQPARPSCWTLQLRQGETLGWQANDWQAWCDPGRAPQDWLHC